MYLAVLLQTLMEKAGPDQLLTGFLEPLVAMGMGCLVMHLTVILFLTCQGAFLLVDRGVVRITR